MNSLVAGNSICQASLETHPKTNLCEVDDPDETCVKTVVNSNVDPDPEITFNCNAQSHEQPNSDNVPKVTDKSSNNGKSTVPKTNVEIPENDEDDELRFKKLHDRLTIFEEGVIKNTNSVLAVHLVLKQIQEKIDTVCHTAETMNKKFESLGNQKEKSPCGLNDKYIEELRSKHSVQLTSVKNKLDMCEKENQYHKNKLSELQKENDKLNLCNEQLKESNETLRIQFYEQKAISEEKESNIHKLQDRLMSIESEINGEKWQTVKPKVKDKTLQVDLSKHDENQSVMNDAPNTEIVDLVNTDELNASKSQDEVITEIETVDLILLHDSVCKHINLNRFLAGSTSKGRSYTTYTISEAAEKLKQLPRVKTLVLHVAVNDLKSQDSAVHCFERYKSLIDEAQNKSDKLIWSLPLPSDEQPLQSNIVAFNSLVLSSFNNSTNIIINKNDNFAENNCVIKKFYVDSIHVNATQGTKLLASNLKRAVFGPKRPSVNPPVSRPTHSNNQSHGSMNMMNSAPRYIQQQQHQRIQNRVNQSGRTVNNSLPFQGNGNYNLNNLPFRGINPQPYIPGLNTSQQRLEGNRYQGFQGYQTQYGQNKEFMANRLTNSIKSAVLDMLNFQ